MNIPLDRLYHFINNVASEIYGDRIVIYRFWPHGSKNINNLSTSIQLDWYEKTVSPAIWCNDQEPLDHEWYGTQVETFDNPWADNPWANILKSVNLSYTPKNLNNFRNIFEKNILLHSEKRSNNLKKYQLDNELISVYYWSHAIIARDWFRYAEHTKQRKKLNKTFLIYNRAWSGTREYRLRFAEHLVRLGLDNECQTSINPIEPELGIHYETHKFKNAVWKPKTALENFFPISNAHSHYSADFDIEDYEATDIEVVLETLFDDNRLHLTEKSLRPIACAQPFILAGTHGSLEYLRSYGFKTFGDLWNESYDQCEDPEERLIKIVDLMRDIANWTPEIRKEKIAQAQAIAQYNRQCFFSQEFFDQVINELKTNLKLAFEELENCNNYRPWIERWQTHLSYPTVVEFLNTNQDTHLPSLNAANQILMLAQDRLSTVAKKK